MKLDLIAPSLDEITYKLSRLRLLLHQLQVDGLLLRRVSSFAWATGGMASYVNTATTDGAAMLLVTADQVHVLTNNIEAPRLEKEEGLAKVCTEAGWDLHIWHWTSPQSGLAKLTQGMRLAVDGPLPGARDASAEIARLRAALLPIEAARMSELSRRCAEAVKTAAHQIRPGMTEQHLAALLGGEAQKQGVQPIVNLIATDERAFYFRHPLPSDKQLDRYAMLVLSGRKWGLVASLTRLVHFGPLPTDLQQRIQSTAFVFACLVRQTRPGQTLEAIFTRAREAYAVQGFNDEWMHHHQGGAAGYEPREYLGLPGSQDVVSAGQAYAWNPTIAGAKFEDTLLVGEDCNQNLTATPDWPEIQIPLIAESADSTGITQPIFPLAGPLVL